MNSRKKNTSLQSVSLGAVKLSDFISLGFSVKRQGQEILFTVTGNGFLQHMVRIMVGTLLEVGKGERDLNTIPTLFGAKRTEAGPAVPACGLCLMEVYY